ncbi:hypothetical protein [Nocardia macrotermitis]|uniref:Uncharacterized protein n=1 Tax=Nocardia macrotermitis TaxID=2585198 RepID=A0A7K0DEI4_9NOCA|nr:hypothetical protein [Nocardia macrotermitis]MQY24127.1 hypothetical protein [Nocardia macrotermitis]
MATGYGSPGSPVEYDEILTPANIAQFLATRSWTKRFDRQFDQVWVLEREGADRPVSVLLPREPSFVDYDKCLREALTAITRAYDIELAELAEKVASVHADLFFVRVDQSMKDGTIPLRQASVLLDGIDQMIRAAALSAHNPHTSGRGRIPDYVNEFLNDGIRMGHTKKGSFVITVAARIDDVETGDRREQPSLLPDAPASFTRRVMTSLATSLDVTRKFASEPRGFADVEDAMEQGLRLPVVQALQEMSAPDGLRSLDLSFEWAAAEPQLASVPSRINLGRGVIDELPEIERRLMRRSEPERLTLVGLVKELKLEDDGDLPDEQGGDVIIHAEVGNRTRRVAIALGGNDWQLAISALRARVPLMVTGELGKRGNIWRLNEPIELDRNYLESVLSGRSY